MNDTGKYEDLASKMLSGEASQQEKNEFAELLRRVPRLASEFNELQRLDTMLRVRAAELGQSPVEFQVPSERMESLRERVQITWSASPPSWWEFVREYFQRKLKLVLCGGAAVLCFLAVHFWIETSRMSLAVADPLIKGLDKNRQLVFRKKILVPKDLEEELRTKLMTGQILAALRDPNWIVLQRSVAASNVVTLSAGNPNERELKLESPVDSALRQPRVAFRWRQVPGSQRYELSLQKQGDNKVERKVTKETELTWAEPAILPGVVYEWQVSAVKLEGQTSESAKAWFKLLTPDELKTLSEFELEYGESPVVLAVVYQRYGLKEDLQRAQAKILEVNPDLKEKPEKTDKEQP